MVGSGDGGTVLGLAEQTAPLTDNRLFVDAPHQPAVGLIPSCQGAID